MGQRRDGRARHSDPVTIRSDAHTEEIATVWTYLLPTEANARLIAAAPELYEALQQALAFLESLEDFRRRPRVDGISHAGSIDDARAALAKADGR
jgi:hypothetical protein